MMTGEPVGRLLRTYDVGSEKLARIPHFISEQLCLFNSNKNWEDKPQIHF